MTAPRLFISYSWSSPAHEERVLRLATDLRENGVDVVLDKWDLREGQDAYVFMESMISSPDIGKVLLVCDRTYVEKANARKGGVGAEAQILSPELYSRHDQTKFVALVFERDDDGNPVVPKYYASRIYIDYSDPSEQIGAFEKLLRWIFDKPLHLKPPVGSIPAFLVGAEAAPVLATSARHRHALQALQDARPNAGVLFSDFLSTLSSELEKFRIDPNSQPFDEEVVRSIEAFLPFRNQYLEVLEVALLHRPGAETAERLQRFFESILRYADKPPNANSWRETDFDNFRFVIHELFLHTVAVLLRLQRFEEATTLLRAEYYWPEQMDRGRPEVVSYGAFEFPLRTLEQRNQRLQLNRLSLHADLLKHRCAELPTRFAQLMQADFVLFLRAQSAPAELRTRWWPITLVYSTDGFSRFEIFARSRSSAFFERLKPVLEIPAVDDLRKLVAEFREGKRESPRWQFERIDVGALTGVDELCKRP